MVLSSSFGYAVDLVSGISTKAAIVLSTFSFTNCCGYGFVDFFLNLGFYYNTVEYRPKHLNKQHINVRKNLCFILYTTASPQKRPSVTSGLRVSVQPAKPA